MSDGATHVSAASGLVRVGDTFVVAVDDEHHVGIFPTVGSTPGRLVRVLPGSLPRATAERKRRKPDLEAIVRIDDGRGAGEMLTVFGSGSTDNRTRAIALTIGPDGLLANAEPVIHDMAGAYARLRDHVADLNIEAVVVVDGHLVLVSRANGAVRHNTVFRVPIDQIRQRLFGAAGDLVPTAVERLDLGTVDGVPLGVTDACLHPDGGWLVSAAAEDTGDSYRDGHVVGAALVWLSEQSVPLAAWRLAPTLKVEGIDARRVGSAVVVWMVTDADDPTVPAALYEARLPAPGT